MSDIIMRMERILATQQNTPRNYPLAGLPFVSVSVKDMRDLINMAISPALAPSALVKHPDTMASQQFVDGWNACRDAMVSAAHQNKDAI